MPDIDAQLRRGGMTHGVIFTTLDLYNGVLKISLIAEAKQKKTFVTEETTAKFERMPFGLKGVPGVFQKYMNTLFKDLREAGNVNTYLDDIILPSRSDMIVVLRKVLEGLSSANLTLKPYYYTFGAPWLDYLSFLISKGVIRPGLKVEAIANFAQPIDVHELRRFLGLSGYFLRFIVNYVSLSLHLTKLTGKFERFE